jgi:hypothetical protein
MVQHRNFRRASRRFEMMVHDGVPESPQPMYQESTHGKTPSRLTGQPSDVPSAHSQGGTVAAVFLLRDDAIVAEAPLDSEEKAE